MWQPQSTEQVTIYYLRGLEIYLKTSLSEEDVTKAIFMAYRYVTVVTIIAHQFPVSRGLFPYIAIAVSPH